MDSKNSFFVAPDVISLLCRNGENVPNKSQENNTAKKSETQGTQRKNNQRGNRNWISMPGFQNSSQKTYSQNYRSQNSSADSENPKQFHHRKQHRFLKNADEGSSLENNAGKNKGFKNPNRSDSFFKEKRFNEKLKNGNYAEHEGREEQNCKQKLKPKKHPKKKCLGQEFRKEKIYKELTKKEKDIVRVVKEEECPDILLTDKLFDKGNLLILRKQTSSDKKLKENCEVASREKSPFDQKLVGNHHDNSTGDLPKNTGAIPKNILRSRSLSSSIYRSVSEGAMELPYDACKSKLKSLIIRYNFVDNLEDIKLFMQENYTKETARKFVEEAIEIMFKKNSQSRKKTSLLISELLECHLLSIHNVTDVLLEIYSNSVDSAENCPLVWIWISELIVPMIISNTFSFIDLRNAGKPFLKSKYAKHLLIPVFNMITEQEGFKFLQARWQSCGVTIADFISQEDLHEFLTKNNLHGLDKQHPISSENLENLVGRKLEVFMDRREHFEHIFNIVMESLSCIEHVVLSNDVREFFQNIFTLDVIKDEVSADYIASKISDMIEFELIYPEVAAKHMSTVFDEDGTSTRNNPHDMQLLAKIFAHLVATKRFKMEHVVTATKPILKTPSALDIFLEFFKILKNEFNENTEMIDSWLKESKITLYDLIDRSHVKDLVERFGFQMCDEHDFKQLPSTLNIQQILFEMVINHEKVDNIMEWIKVHEEKNTETHSFKLDVLSAVYEGCLYKGLDMCVFSEYRKLLSTYVNIDEKDIIKLETLLKLMTTDEFMNKEDKSEAPLINHKEKQNNNYKEKSSYSNQINSQNKEKVEICLEFNLKNREMEQEVKDESSVIRLSKVGQDLENARQTCQDISSEKPEEQKSVLQNVENQGNGNVNPPETVNSLQENENKTKDSASEQLDEIVPTKTLNVDNTKENIKQQTESGINMQQQSGIDASKQDIVCEAENTASQKYSLEQIQMTIIEDIKKGTHYRWIQQSINKNLADSYKGPVFTKILTNCIIQSSFDSDKKTFNLENFRYYGKLLTLFNNGNMEYEITSLCAVQDYIRVQPDLKQYISSIFNTFLMEELVSKDALLEFMDLKIKGDVLITLSTFYEKLMEN